MSELLFLLFIASGLYVYLGIKSPEKTPFWNKGLKGEKINSALTFGITTAVLIILFGITLKKSPSNQNTKAVEQTILPVETVDSSNKKQGISKTHLSSIPDLTAVNVYGNLTDKGFTLSKRIGSELSSWDCKQETNEYLYLVVINGTSPTNIQYVTATVQNYSSSNTNAIAKDFLGYVASLQYQNASPTEAKSWVIKNVGKKSKTKFGGVIFETFGDARTRILSIGVED